MATRESLVLNASYEPICIVPARRALTLVLADKAEVVTEGDGVFRGVSCTIQVPSVVRLTEYVPLKRRTVTGLSRKSVFVRDRWTCVYCGGPANTIDHVVPKSKGGGTTWDNVVATCAGCNHAKADKSLKEMGWTLRVAPAAPVGLAWMILGRKNSDPRWTEWVHSRVDSL